MKIAILTQYYPPEMGAPQGRLSELAKSIVSLGHEVIVLTAMPSYPLGRTFDGYGGLLRRETRDGVSVIRTWAYPTQSPSIVKRLATYFSFVFSSLLFGTFTLPRVDYLLTESPPVFLGLSGMLLSKLKGARWIFNVSDLWTETAVRIGVLSGDGWKFKSAQKLEHYCYKTAWLVSGQSQEIIQQIARQVPGVNTYHLSNGVNTKMFQPANRREETRKELGFGDDCIALYAGLHGLAQGLMQVLDAAEKLRRTPGLQIVFVGDGPDKQALIKAAKERQLSNVRFLDPVPREKMPLINSAADIGLVPLKVELPGAVPSKLYEYMGSGLPVILAATGEPVRIVEASQCGFTVTPEDPDALASAILKLASDRALRNEFAAAGRVAAERSYDRTVISARFVDYLIAEQRPLQKQPHQLEKTLGSD